MLHLNVTRMGLKITHQTVRWVLPFNVPGRKTEHFHIINMQIVRTVVGALSRGL